jgi:SM-20-related protein
MSIPAVSANENGGDRIFEELIDGLITNQFGVVNDFLDEDLVKGLRANLQKKWSEGQMHPAGIGKRFSFQKNLKVRGYQISWIDNDSEDV